MNKAELELMHRELDGENSPDESRRLEALLAENREARELFDQLSAVDSHLRQEEMVEAPAGLKQSVMEALPDTLYRSSMESTARPAKSTARETGLGAFLRGLWDTMQARPALAYAYTFVLGLVVGLGLYAVALQDSASAESGLHATFVDAEALENLSTAGTTPIELPGFSGQVELLTSRELFVVDLKADAEERVDVRLVPEPALTLRGFTRRTGNTAASMDIGDDGVVLGIEGSERYSLLFDRAADTESIIRLQVRRDGRLMYEERLRPEDI